MGTRLWWGEGLGWECVGCLFSIVCNDVDGGCMFAKLGFLFLLLSVPGVLNWFASNTMLIGFAALMVVVGGLYPHAAHLISMVSGFGGCLLLGL